MSAKLPSFEEAAAACPKQAEIANAATGKRRNRLRRILRENHALYQLRTIGSTCLNCKHYEPNAYNFNKDLDVCSLHSDFHGTYITSKDNVCLDHKWKEK